MGEPRLGLTGPMVESGPQRPCEYQVTTKVLSVSTTVSSFRAVTVVSSARRKNVTIF